MTDPVLNLFTAMNISEKYRNNFRGFPYFADVLRQAGVTRCLWQLPACEVFYFTKHGNIVMQATALFSKLTTVLPVFSQDDLLKAINSNRSDEVNFHKFLKLIWKAGVVSFEFNFEARTISYFGINGETHLEYYELVVADVEGAFDDPIQWVEPPYPHEKSNSCELRTAKWDPRDLPDEITYEEWIRYVFDHPILQLEWYFLDEGSPYYGYWNEDANPARTLSFLTKLFEEPEGLITRFNRAEINQGMHFLVSTSCSNHMFALTDESLPWEDRKRCFNAMIPLFTKLMAPVFGDDVEYGLLEVNDNSACFMWWDVIPLSGNMDHPDGERINEVGLHVLEQILNIKAESCMESAIHGLGHWHHEFPEQVRELIEKFLTRTDISDGLRWYAEQAKIGHII